MSTATSTENRPALTFSLGRLVQTAGAESSISTGQALEYFRRHAGGDFGDLCAGDYRANLHAIAQGERILSAYHCGEIKLYVITEADRSATTLLLAEEY
jgi:hypothetical protein